MHEELCSEYSNVSKYGGSACGYGREVRKPIDSLNHNSEAIKTRAQFHKSSATVAFA